LAAHLIEYLCESALFFDFPASGKNEILRLMAQSLCQGCAIPDPETVLEAIYHREDERSTGIGRGLAVPHCRSSKIDSIHISLAVLEQGVNWNAIDRQPVQIIFLVVGSEQKPEQYLQVLSDISRLIRNDRTREKLLQCRTARAVRDLFSN